MKYETPQLTPLTPAINAIQGVGSDKSTPNHDDSITGDSKETNLGYKDWE